jgi:hypothetical protein
MPRFDDVVRVLPPAPEVKRKQLLDLDDSKAQQVRTSTLLLESCFVGSPFISLSLKVVHIFSGWTQGSETCA